MKRQIIGIAGKARSGKDTVASLLWVHGGYTRLAFADPVKMATQAMFGLTRAQTWDDELKEIPIARWGLSPRQMFQLVGTECVKPIFGDDIWIKRMLVDMEFLGEDNIVIPDVRFETEADFIRMSGGKILHLVRPGVQSVAKHVSESGVKVVEGDLAIVNDGTMEDLGARVLTLINTLIWD
jgi:hypothetical protein